MSSSIPALLPVVVAAALVCSSAAVLSAPAASPAPRETAASGAVSPSVRHVAVPGVDRHDRAGVATGLQSDAGPELVAQSAVEEVSGYAVVGATWREGSTPLGLSMAVRTRSGGQWSSWQPMDVDEDHAPDPGSPEGVNARPGSDPMVIGAVDAVQLRARSESGAAPAALELSLIDPGVSPTDATVGAPAYAMSSARASGSPSEALAGSSTATSTKRTAGTTPQPAIFSRAQWGADERLRSRSPSYGEVHAAFVHHTVNANDYTEAEVPAIIRGIYAYHTKSRGWSDVGYNFLVDRFGRIWEGRYGGVDRPVIGAHTLGYNENAFAMSAIGNFELVHPSDALLDAYGRLFAWKLGLHGIRPKSTQLVAGDTFPAINGHRDAGQTLCPGAHLYARLPEIRSSAASYQRSYRGRDVPHDVAGSRRPDLLARDAGTGAVQVLPGDGSPGFGGPLPTGQVRPGVDTLLVVGDWDGDGYTDVMSRLPGTGRLRLHLGDGSGRLGDPVRRWAGWGDRRAIVSPGDISGDGLPDLLAQDTATGEVYLYPNDGRGGFGDRWIMRSTMLAADLTAAAGRWDKDGSPDIIVRERATGALWLYRINGPGGLMDPVLLRRHFSRYDALVGVGDFDGDGHSDLLARQARSGEMYLFPGTTTGLGARSHVASPMAGYDLLG
jgi:hypothetical protein